MREKILLSLSVILCAVQLIGGDTVRATIYRSAAHHTGNWDSPDDGSVKRYTHATAGDVIFIPPAYAVIDLGTRVLISPDNASESKAEYLLDPLYSRHNAKHWGKYKVEGEGEGPPPIWSVTAIDNLDLDVDSDNNSDYDNPERNDAEDEIEEDSPGKIFQVNDGDRDGDLIGDFCDGFNADSGITDDNILDTNEKAAFGIPMVLEIKDLQDEVKPSDVKYTFEYSASPPTEATIKKIMEDGKIVGYKCKAPAGFRIWMNKNKTRKKKSVNNGGDFVPAGQELDAVKVGMDDSKQTFYVEATPGSEEFKGDKLFIIVKAKFISPKQGKIVFNDKVRICPFKIDLDISRLDGTTVNEEKEHGEGSITKILNPNDSKDNVEKWRLNIPSLTFKPEYLLEDGHVKLKIKRVGPSESIGKCKILKEDGSSYLNDVNENGKNVGIDDLDKVYKIQPWSTIKESEDGTGIIDIALVAYNESDQEIANDTVRASFVLFEPYNGDIRFINKNSENAEVPYNDFEKNAAHNLDELFDNGEIKSNTNIIAARNQEFILNNYELPIANVFISSVGGKWLKHNQNENWNIDWEYVINYSDMPTLKGNNNRIFRIFKDNITLSAFKINDAKTDGAVSSGGAILGFMSKRFKCLGCSFKNNFSPYVGGAMHLGLCSNSEIKFSYFHDNLVGSQSSTTRRLGGALNINSSSNSMLWANILGMSR